MTLSLHHGSNDNDVRTLNLTTSRNLFLKSTMFQHRTILIYTWTHFDGKIHKQIYHILIDRRWYTIISEGRKCRKGNCDTDQYIKVAIVSERLAVGKQEAQKYDRERINL